jgi:hypothetical protein
MNNISRWAVFASVAAAVCSGLAWAKEPPQQAVEKAVQERTGVALRWQQDAAAREEALAQVRAILTWAYPPPICAKRASGKTRASI